MGLGLRQKTKEFLNAAKRLTRSGIYWYWLDPEAVEPSIPIVPLVYPHRYDILLRKSYFDFYAAHFELYIMDFDAYLELAMTHSYFKWFVEVLMVRFETADVGNPSKTKALFAQRLREAAKLYDSIQAEGFNPAFPIIPYTGLQILPMDSGRVATGKYHMGDGCHRLACLMSMGYDALPREFVRVKCFSRLVPLDNTLLLQDHLEIAWPAGFGDRGAV